MWSHALSGFFIQGLDEERAENLRRDPRVLSVERNGEARATGSQTLTLGNGHWGLDRVDVRQLAYDSVFDHHAAGDGAHVYIIDSGINDDHDEFQGRIGAGVAFLTFSINPSPYIDQEGHGTAVASMAAGTLAGVAKDATIHSVRIADDNLAYYDDMVDGLDWVAANAVAPAVANLSYETNTLSVALAMKGVVEAGVVMVTSAGNDGVDACDDGGNTVAIIAVVGATTQSDFRYGNYGECIDIFAPGVSVIAALHDDDDGFDEFTGTSLAAPMVAGLAAVIAAGSPVSLDPAEVLSILYDSGTTGELSSIGSGSPNLLLYSLYGHAEIAGPAEVTSDTINTVASWSSEVHGPSSWSYEWEASVDGGAYQTVSTSSAYIRTIVAFSNYDLDLRLTATSGSMEFTDSISVVVSYDTECGGPTDPC